MLTFSDIAKGDVFEFFDDAGEQMGGKFIKIDPLPDDACGNGVANAVALDSTWHPKGDTTYATPNERVVLVC